MFSTLRIKPLWHLETSWLSTYTSPLSVSSNCNYLKVKCVFVLVNRFGTLLSVNTFDTNKIESLKGLYSLFMDGDEFIIKETSTTSSYFFSFITDALF